jgi:hypothetical protein
MWALFSGTSTATAVSYQEQIDESQIEIYSLPINNQQQGNILVWIPNLYNIKIRNNFFKCICIVSHFSKTVSVQNRNYFRFQTDHFSSVFIPLFQISNPMSKIRTFSSTSKDRFGILGHKKWSRLD